MGDTGHGIRDTPHGARSWQPFERRSRAHRGIHNSGRCRVPNAVSRIPSSMPLKPRRIMPM